MMDRLAVEAPLVAAVGREELLSEMLEHLRGGERLLCLVGPGGAGKTLLARHVARRLRRDGWGIRFVDASACRDERSFVATVAHAVGVRLATGSLARQRGQIVTVLSDAARELLLLDNLEQLGEQALPLLQQLADVGTPVLATSRLALRAPLIRIVDVPPLGIDDGVALFERRASTAGRRLQAGDRETAARIVAALDGLPVAIELAASRLGLMTVHDLYRGLEAGGFELLRAGETDFEAVIARSWQLLDGDTQSVLAACSVFEGGFRLDAARAVATSDPLEVLDRLQRHSLLLLRQGRATSRLSVLESLRDYARRHAPAAVAEARRRHADHFFELAHGWLARWDVPPSRAELDAIADERHNLLAAFVCLCARDPRRGVTVALALDRHLAVSGSPAEQIQLLAEASRLVEAVDPLLRSNLHLARGRALRRAGQLDEAERALDRALAEAPEDAALPRARAWQTLGRIALIRGDGELAAGRYRRAMAEAEACNDALTIMRITRDRADLDDDLEQARAALAMATKMGDPLEEGFAHWVLARHLRGRGRLTEADAHFERAVGAARESGDLYLEALVVASIGRALHQATKTTDAIAAFRKALAIQRRAGNEAMTRWLHVDLGAALHDDGQIGEAEQQLRQGLQQSRAAADAMVESLALAHLALLTMRRDEGEGRRMLAEAARQVGAATDRDLRSLATACLALMDHLDGGPSLPDVAAVHDLWRGSDRDVSVATFLRLARAWLKTRATASAPASESTWKTSPEAELLLWTTGGYQVGGCRVELQTDSPLHRILTALAEAQRIDPASALSRQHLVAAGWPGERIDRRAASNRLRNAVSRLRRAGLGDLLITRSDGYQLRPDAVVRREKR
jgi:predicted ATPase/Tfp pilus assembly protein PilF